MAETDPMDHLREHVDLRFADVEKWLEKLSGALDKMIEERGHRLVLDQRVTQLEKDHGIVQKRMRELEIDQAKRFRDISTTQTKHAVLLWVGTGVAILLANYVIERFLI